MPKAERYRRRKSVGRCVERHGRQLNNNIAHMAVAAMFAMIGLGFGIGAREFGGGSIRIGKFCGILVRMALTRDVDRALDAEKQHRHDDCDANEKSHSRL
jgi:hypothetical protein